MMQRYEKILRSFETWYPNLYKQTVECIPLSRHCVLVAMDDGTRMEYNSLDNSIRNVTNLYIRHGDDSMDEVTWRNEFGRKLRRLMTENFITQEQLADMAGVSRQMMSRYLKGTSTPSGYILRRLAGALNCDVRELTVFGYDDE